MIPIDVVWLCYHTNSDVHAHDGMPLLLDLLDGQVASFQKYEFKRIGAGALSEFPPRSSGAVIVVSGRLHAYMIDYIRLSQELRRLKWAIIIVAGDEEQLFRWEELQHPHMRVWVQGCNPSRNPDYRLPWGSSFRFQERTVVQKDLDWAFVGQMNHIRRSECVEVLQRLDGGFLQTAVGHTDFFGREKYLSILRQAKIAPCPGGTESPDSKRIWEALEAGCIPVLDRKAGVSGYPYGYWEKLFDVPPPFPIVDDWKDLPRLMQGILADWDKQSKQVADWWASYKLGLAMKLESDIESLRQENA